MCKSGIEEFVEQYIKAVMSSLSLERKSRSYERSPVLKLNYSMYISRWSYLFGTLETLRDTCVNRKEKMHFRT